MQIDFHHSVTYVVARLAGFDHEKAEVIAYAAQYVDDSTTNSTILFDNQAMYYHISSAHKMLDYKNFDKLSNHQAWVPFHFLPGNGGLPRGEEPGDSFVEKIICRSNSYIAQDMVKECISDIDTCYTLHRLGISMHVFADTWAHQGFAGINHEINDIRALDDEDEPDRGFFKRLKKFFRDRFDEKAGKFIGMSFPLGHGAALSFPDLPFLKWSYRWKFNGNKQKVERDNTQLFLEAADEMCKWMQRYIEKDAEAVVSGLSDEDFDKIKNLFEEFTDEDGRIRHEKWLTKIEEGYFTFGSAKISYEAEGIGSWRYDALGTDEILGSFETIHIYNPSFMKSDWKLFQDALQAHRFKVIHDILPKYGICAA